MAVTHAIHRPQLAGHESIRELQPMGLAQSVVLFGVPAGLLALSLYVVQPALIDLGLSAPLSFAISLTLINVGLLVAAVVGYLHEGRPLTWGAFASRMRLKGMGGRDWKWTLGGMVVLLALTVLVSWVAVTVYNLFNFTQPNFGSTGGDQVLVWVTLLFNIVGEELWWRGYILPRQELAFGGRTWILHGLMWACFHMYKWWSVPFMMITCLVIPFVAQRLKNTTAAAVMHFTLNALGNIAFVVVLLMQIIGVR